MAGLKNSEIVIGEGITEEYYFKSIRDVISNRPTPKPLKPYNMAELENAIKRYAIEGYSKIHCLIDMDKKVKEPKTMEEYKKLKQKYDRKQVKKTDCEVRFYESFPSVEQFFYYYFENSTAEQTNNGLKSWLRHKCGYETSEKWLKAHSVHNTFIKHGGCLRNAIKNAKNSVRARVANNFNYSYTEIGELIEYLGVK